MLYHSAVLSLSRSLFPLPPSLSLSPLSLSPSPQCQVTKCSVLVCWLGRESLQRECISLVKDLWSQGIAADLLYESIEVDSVEDIQDFCRRNFIPHVVILNDKTLLFERKQVSSLRNYILWLLNNCACLMTNLIEMQLS